MIDDDLTINILSYLVIIPAAFMCFIPMRHQLRYGGAFSIISMFSVLVIIVVTGAVVEDKTHLTGDQIFFPLLFICFIFYVLLVNTPLFKSLSIFIFVMTALSFVTNISTGLSISSDQRLTFEEEALQSTTLQLTLITLTALILAFPLYYAWTWLIDNLDISAVWLMATLVSALFLSFNLLISERGETVLAIDEGTGFFWSAIITMLALYIILLIMFYYIVKEIVDKADTEAKNRIFEMEESQYIKQQQYMKDSQEARHDFKHAIRTLNELCKEGDFDAVTDFITKYSDALPENEVRRFSDNNAVNATMNFYADSAERNKIDIDWLAAIPDNLPLSDLELCNMIGNILENAVFACQDIPEEQRWIQLTAQAPNSSQFLIVATNSFNGHVRKRRGVYLSTRRNSSGIGLSSITRTAERYGGTAEFSHKGNEFYSNIIIPLDNSRSVK